MAQEMILAKLSQLQGFGEKFIAKMGEVSERVRTLEAVGAQANLIERILVNGDPLSIGANKTVNIPVPTRVNQLENDASYQENVIERIQVNGATQGITNKTVNVHMPTAVSELTNDENYQTNVLEGVKVNGTALTVDSEKNVNVNVPTKVSQLTNDKTYQTKSEVENTVKTAVAGSKHTSFQKVSSVPAVADAKEDIMYLVMNSVTKHYDIYAKIADDAGNFKMELLDDTTVDLSGYVQKEAGKGLSHNDFTDALLAKLNGIAEKANLYVHPSHTAYAEGLYKVTVNALGHVTKATAVTKADITGLGIPGQDTHDWVSITGKPTSYPPSGHTHDDRYYTESEMNTKLGSKVDNSQDGASDLIGKLESGSAAPTDDDLMITQWANHKNDPGHDNIYVRRPMSSLWSYVKGKADSVYQPKGSYAASSHTHTKNQITDFPTSLPASDVSAWAKATSKPSYAWSEITSKPSTFAPSSHNHDSAYYKKSEIDEKLKGTSATGHTHAWTDITNKPTTFAPSAHKHVKADITDFPTSMPASDVKAWAKAATKPSYAWSEITGKPSTFAPSTHSHAWGDITGKPSTFAPSAHKHVKADITDFPTSLPASDVSAWAKAANKPSYSWGEITGKPSTFTPASHTHDDRYYTESEINSKLGTKAESIVLAADVNLNNVTTPGIYSCGGGNSIVNKPSGLDAIGLIVVHNASGGYYTQILTSSSNANTYRRTCLNGTWSAWTQDKYTDTNTWRGIQNNLTSTATDQSLSAAQGKALKDLVDGKAPSSHTHAWGDITGKPTTFAPSSHSHDDRYYTESEMDTKLIGKANSSHTHNYAGSSSAGGTANSVNGFTFGVQTSDPGANSSLTTNKFLFVYE